MKVLTENDIWKLVEKPDKCEIIDSKWVFKIKDKEGKINNFKFRLVARGFKQKVFEDVYSPAVRLATIRTILVVYVKLIVRFANLIRQYMALKRHHCIGIKNLYIKVTSNAILYVLIFVDDMLTSGSSVKKIEMFNLSRCFKMKDPDLLNYFLGICV